LRGQLEEPPTSVGGGRGEKLDGLKTPMERGTTYLARGHELKPVKSYLNTFEEKRREKEN